MSQQFEPTAEQIKEKKIYQEMGLTDEEYASACEKIGRLPNYTETGLFSVMWSEHCSYKNSKVLLKKFPTEGERVLQGPGEGAGIVDIGDEQAVVFKIESHNSPTAIEPFQGAATGAGGILRDVFSMGARPIALLNSLRFGELDSDRVKYLFEEAVAGIASYGNGIGVPTVGGEVGFDPCYAANPLVNAMCVGLIDHKDMQKGQAKGVGNTVMYVGASTGRDGIHGATMSSAEVDEEDESRSAIQAGDPYLEKLVMEACLELIQLDSLIGIQDMGAAGLTSSSAEMADKAGSGIEMNLDLVPQREEGMTPYEMMLSESQERMLIVVKKGHEQEVKEIFDRWGLYAVEIGHVTDDQQLRLLHKGEVVTELPVEALADAPTYHKPSSEPAYYREYQAQEEKAPEVADVKEAFIQLLAQPTIASKEWVYRQYDHMAQANTIVAPGSDAAVIRIRGTEKAVAMTTDCNARYIYLDPEVGGKIAVAEAARNIVCSGAEPIALTDGLNYGSPENPEIFWQLEKSTDGMSEACRILDTPVIGGNVSLFNEKSGTAVYPTPIIGMVGLIENYEHITTQSFKQAGDLIYLIGETKMEFGGSELQKMIEGSISGKAPSIDLTKEKQQLDQLLQAIRAGVVESAHDLSEGGLSVALAESMMDTGLGVHASIAGDTVTELFSESQSRIIVSVNANKAAEFEKIVEAKKLGEVTNTHTLVIEKDGEVILQATQEEMATAWKEAIPSLLKA